MISLLGIGVLIYVVFILIIQLSDLAIFEVGEKPVSYTHLTLPTTPYV